MRYLELSTKRQREVDRLWSAARKAAGHYMAMAKQHGCDSDQAIAAWLAEDAAWEQAIPRVGGYPK